MWSTWISKRDPVDSGAAQDGRPAEGICPEKMLYQLGWTTLPGLGGLSVSEFRATPSEAPDLERGMALEFPSDSERLAFLREAESEFAARRFANAADAFDTVKAWVIERAGRKLA